MRKVIAIVAMDENRVIGFENAIPWKLSEDLKRFSQITTGHTVLMGSKTFWSLPDKYRPLPSRDNIVATRNPENFKDEKDISLTSDPVQLIKDFKSGSLDLCSDYLFIIGGSNIYELTLTHCGQIFLTLVKGKHQGDAYFIEFEQDFELISVEDFQDHSFLKYQRVES